METPLQFLLLFHLTWHPGNRWISRSETNLLCDFITALAKGRGGLILPLFSTLGINFVSRCFRCSLCIKNEKRKFFLRPLPGVQKIKPPSALCKYPFLKKSRKIQRSWHFWKNCSIFCDFYWFFLKWDFAESRGFVHCNQRIKTLH